MHSYDPRPWGGLLQKRTPCKESWTWGTEQRKWDQTRKNSCTYWTNMYHVPSVHQTSQILEHHSMEQRKPRPTQSSHGSCRTLCGQVMLGQSFHNEAAVLRTQSTKAHSCLHTGESPMKCEMPLPLFCLTNAYSFGGCLSFI